MQPTTKSLKKKYIHVKFYLKKRKVEKNCCEMDESNISHLFRCGSSLCIFILIREMHPGSPGLHLVYHLRLLE